MSVEQALWRAVHANPRDVAPRLIYADWLEEQGDERGEFIRVQCELVAGIEDDPRAAALRQREQTLSRTHREAWSAALRQFGAVGFYQGIPSQLYLPADRLLQLVQIKLTLHSNKLREAGGRRLASCRWAKSIAALNLFRCQVGDRGISALAKSMTLAQLHSLDVDASDVRAAGVASLVKAPWFKQLRRLYLSGNVIGDDGVKALVESGQAVNLRCLALANCGLTEKGIHALADWPVLANVRSLSQGGNRLTDAGAEALAHSPYVGQLESLKLYGFDGVGVRGRDALFVRLGDRVEMNSSAGLLN